MCIHTCNFLLALAVMPVIFGKFDASHNTTNLFAAFSIKRYFLKQVDSSLS